MSETTKVKIMSALAQPNQQQIGPSDIANSLHNSRFCCYLAQTLQVGFQHPDDKRKTASAYQQDQNVVLTQEFRARQMSILQRHYPGQFNTPKKTSSEFKREMDALKTNFEAKQKLIEKMTKMLFDMVDLSEEHAFLSEVPGWNNRNYFLHVEASRQAHPYTPPQNLCPHPYALPAAFAIEDGMSALTVSKGGGKEFDV